MFEEFVLSATQVQSSVTNIPSTLTEVFLSRTSGLNASRPYLKHKPERGKPYETVTYGEFGEQVRQLANALRALGVERGDRIAMLSESRPEWVTMDFAALALGAITVPMFPSLTAKQMEYIVAHCGAKVILVSNDLQLGKALKSLPECPELHTIILCNATTNLKHDAIASTVIHFADLKKQATAPDFDFEKEARLAKPEDIITIIYTSGTTGTPKGVMLTHGNLISNIEGAIAVLPDITEEDVFLSFLPLCHSFERVASYLVFVKGVTVAYAESIETVADNMLEIRPTIMTGVPRFYERIYSRLMRAREKMSDKRRKIFDWGFSIGQEVGKEREGLPVSIGARILHPIADKLVLSKVRERTGGRIRFFVSGAAALPAEVGRAFAAFGLPIIEGYGMTESSPIISVNPYKKVRWGSVGVKLHNVEVKLAEDGEILTRGPHVMKGYYLAPHDTEETIDKEGWLHTGDIGEMDEEQYIKIVDRKKHLFVSSGGKNIAPAPIESLITQSKFIEQVMLIGDKRQYCTALLVPEFESLREYLKEAGIDGVASNEQLVQKPEVQGLIESEIEKVQKDVASFERVRKFALLPEPFTVENSMLTPTLKVKRKEVEKRYEQLIESLYQ